MAMRKSKPNSDPYKITGREFQRSLFLANIRQQLGQIADAHSQIFKAARRYASEGMDPNEIKELLIIDGFDDKAVDGCLEQLADDAGNYQQRWGFEIEDGYGRITSHAEIGDDSASEEEAREQVEELIAEGAASRLIRIFRIS